MSNYVSDAVVRRLPVYYRHLKELENEGVEQISSQDLGDRMGFTASQIRQDINCFGGFGRQGYGYNVKELRGHMAQILGVDRKHTMVIIGAGNIGRALAMSDSFPAAGFKIVALFDKNEMLIGKKIGHYIVQSVEGLKEFLNHTPVDIGVLAVPANDAQPMAEELMDAGIRGIWNFAPVDLNVRSGVSLVAVHLEDGLEILSYRMLNGG